ncbi:MAG TPA: polysaccharide deacetylase family protein [Terriglobales bacterium]|nr:polysaccharide deacetylase family protein [Terriglobales bacterium]
MQEIPGAEICGIIQQPMEKLPLAQRHIASGDKVHKGWFRLLREKVVHRALWVVHGCPPNLNAAEEFTAEKLAKKCNPMGWPFLAENIGAINVVDFIRRQNAGLILVLGELPLNPELLSVLSHDVIRARAQTGPEQVLQITIEHFARGSGGAFTIASLNIPLQPYDGSSGFTLKTDLITDDLLLQTAAGLQTGTGIQTSKTVTEWTRKIVEPYLAQLEPAPIKTAQAGIFNQRFRSTWKLCLDTLSLCSLFAARNWYRRLRGQYPVLVLAHHLISDRPHRMGMTTEDFWKVLCFLQRHYRIVSLSQAFELLRLGDVKVPTLVLTFDDGYADNFVSLRAVAQEAGIPVTLFIATQPVEIQREFLHDSAQGIRGLLPLTWDQIRYWSLRGAEFGSHTRTHCDCGSIDRVKLEWELIGSRHDLEGHLGKPVSFFAFPFGQPKNISSDAIEVAASTYAYFASCLGGENLPNQAMEGRRHFLRKTFYSDLWELELELQSVFDWVDAIKQKIGRKQPEPNNLPDRVSVASAFE